MCRMNGKNFLIKKKVFLSDLITKDKNSEITEKS